MSLFNKSFISIIFDKISLLIDRLARKIFRFKYHSESTTKKYLLDTKILEQKIVKKIDRTFYSLLLVILGACIIAIYSDVKYQKAQYTHEQKSYLNQLSSDLNDISTELYDTFYNYNNIITNSKNSIMLAENNILSTHTIDNSSFYGVSQDKKIAVYGNGTNPIPSNGKAKRVDILNNFDDFYYLYKTLNWLDGISYISKDYFTVSTPSTLLKPYSKKIFSTSALEFPNKFFNYAIKSSAEEKGERWLNESILSSDTSANNSDKNQKDSKEKKYKNHLGYLYPISIKKDNIIDGVALADVNIEKIFTDNTKNLDYSKVISKTNAYIMDSSGKILAGYDIKQQRMIPDKELYMDSKRILDNDILSPKYLTTKISTIENSQYTTFIKHSYYSGLTLVYSIPETHLILKYLEMSNYLIYIILFAIAILLMLVCYHTIRNIAVKPIGKIIYYINALNNDRYQSDIDTSDVISFWQGRLRLIFSMLKNKYNEIGDLSIQASIDHETQLPKKDKFITMVEDALSQSYRKEQEKNKNLDPNIVLHIDPNENENYNGDDLPESPLSDLAGEDADAKNSVVIVFNIENFSHLSTLYSAEVMDTLIKQFASSLLLFSNAYENTLNNQHYIFSRLTATKFCAFIQVNGSVDIESVVNQLATSLSAPIIIPNGDTLIMKIYIGASIILGTDIFHPKKVKSILNNNIKKADIALSYAAEYDDPVKYANEDILAVESYNNEQKQRLLDAIKSKTFDMVFQPYFDIESKSIKGIEALIRWDQNDIMPISTSQIIEQAKRNNLVTEIDKILFEKIEESAPILNSIPMAENPYMLSLNVSVAYFFSPEFSAFISRLHKNLDATKWLIAIEIHEDLMYDNIANINSQIARLKQQNINISIDNFGAGRASLEALTKVHIDTIKLSPTITSNLNTDSHYKQIVSLLKHLKELTNINIVAVGLNNALTLEQLQDLGIDIIQSYKIGKITDLQETMAIISNSEEIDAYFHNEALSHEGQE